MLLKIKNGRAQVEAGVVTAATYTTGDELAKAIEDTIKKHFPRSTVVVGVKKSLGSKLINIFFAVAGGKDQVTNGIWENDISLTKAFIYGVNEDGSLKDRLEFEPVMGGSLLVNPEPGSGMAFSKVKVGLRKKKGTPEQVLKHVDTYFKKLAKAVKDNADKIPERHKALLKGIL